MNPQTVSKILGLTQEDLSGLLGVSRSRLAMYETGKRGLPLQATELLGYLLTRAKEAQTLTKSNPHTGRQQTHRRQYIERLLLENEYQRETVKLKIAAAERKIAAQGQLLKLASCVLQSEAAKTADTSHRTFLASKSAQIEAANTGATLEKLRLKQELLDVERKYLQSLLD